LQGAGFGSFLNPNLVELPTIVRLVERGEPPLAFSQAAPAPASVAAAPEGGDVGGRR
jgi:hypothetical protein